MNDDQVVLPLELIDDGVNQGLPKLDRQSKTRSFFEFWPVWLVYIPVVVYWICLSIKHRGFSLPMIANPNIWLGGMVGESKAEILSSAGDALNHHILPFIKLTRSYDSAEVDTLITLEKMAAAGFNYPVVAKPNLGCRGAGVRLVKTREDLTRFLQDFPATREFLIQRKAPFSAEAGVFYCRHPDAPEGRVMSLTLKYTPVIVGDGCRTISQLIQADERAGSLLNLYFPRFEGRLDEIIACGDELPLVFAGSHSRGSVFKDGAQFISRALERRIDQLMKDLPEFHYGRLDIKFSALHSFMRGEDFYIIEINGASSEATHIWDSDGSLTNVFKTLFYQYRTLFNFGVVMRERGCQPPSAITLIRTWLDELKWAKLYPSAD